MQSVLISQLVSLSISSSVSHSVCPSVNQSVSCLDNSSEVVGSEVFIALFWTLWGSGKYIVFVHSYSSKSWESVKVNTFGGTSITVNSKVNSDRTRRRRKVRHLLTNVKDRDEPNKRQGVVYKIKCSDCQASYIGETGRNVNTRLTKHKRICNRLTKFD